MTTSRVDDNSPRKLALELVLNCRGESFARAHSRRNMTGAAGNTKLAGSTLSTPAMIILGCQRNQEACPLSTSGRRPTTDSVTTATAAAAAATTAASATTTAPATTTAAAATGKRHAATGLVDALLVEDIERGEGDVRELFFAERNS